LKKDLFILSAPFQIISAIEAHKYFKTEEAYLIIFEDKSEEVNNILKNAYQYIEWKEIFVFKKSQGKSRFLNSLKFLQEFKSKKFSFRYVFSGFIFSKTESYINRVLALNVNSQKIIALDDGIATISYKYLFKEKVPLIKSLKWNLFGFKTNLKNKFSIFTFFNLNLENYVEIIKNDFSYFHTKVKKFQTQEENFYFIGGPLVENSYLTKDEFERLMQKIFLFAKEKCKNIYFIPHRFCSNKNLKIVEKIGFQILNFSKPIEFEFLERKEKPVNIASTISTALLSLKVIFGVENALSFKIREDEIKFLNLYKNYSDFGIQLISLNKNMEFEIE
jgi:hypothetical protein